MHLGECDLGCSVNARNTLDLNYLAVAKQTGARSCRSISRARSRPTAAMKCADEIVNDKLEARTFSPKFVVIAAGSLGPTELLLRSKAAGTLQNLSARLGEAWSSNGDFLTPAIHPFRDVRPAAGRRSTAAIDLLDGEYMSKAIFVEDGGLPDLAWNALSNGPRPIRPRTIG